MLMKYITFDDHLKEQLKDPEFRRIWEKSEPQRRIASQLIKARIEQDVSQKQLAKKIGTTQAVISRIENSSVNPSIGIIYKLATALGKKLEINFV